MAHAHKGTIGRPAAISRHRPTAAVSAVLAITAAAISLALFLPPQAHQYDPANMGGTSLAPQAGTGQYDPANLGGTPLAPEQAAGQGQYDPANLGGTP